MGLILVLNFRSPANFGKLVKLKSERLNVYVATILRMYKNEKPIYVAILSEGFAAYFTLFLKLPFFDFFFLFHNVCIRCSREQENINNLYSLVVSDVMCVFSGGDRFGKGCFKLS